MNKVTPDFQEIGKHFCVYGDFVGAQPYGSGHINDSFAATYDVAGAKVRYFHQRVNHNIFKDVPALMENVERVTRHLKQKMEAKGVKQLSRRALTLVPTLDGKSYFMDAEGGYWRTYLFIEGASTQDIIRRPADAEQAAAAFGRFQELLADLPGGRLNETIPDFHNTPARYVRFEAALKKDVANRAALAKKEIDIAIQYKHIVTRLLDLNAKGEIPERTTHNDTKLNNVMLDDKTGEGICVVDLDTVMPGLTLYDFGDMVRSGTNSAPEDERDLSKTHVRLEIYEALVKGYLSAARAFLTPVEVREISFAGRLITFEIGLRFLTDFLDGDVYFKTHREGQNLDRCRTQFTLARQMDELAEQMSAIVACYA